MRWEDEGTGRGRGRELSWGAGKGGTKKTCKLGESRGSSVQRETEASRRFLGSLQTSFVFTTGTRP